MVQGRRGPGLALEALERLRVCGHRVREELERHGAPQARVLGFVDDTHAAAAKLAQDAVVGEGLSDHRSHARAFCRMGFIIRAISAPVSTRFRRGLIPLPPEASRAGDGARQSPIRQDSFAVRSRVENHSLTVSSPFAARRPRPNQLRSSSQTPRQQYPQNPNRNGQLGRFTSVRCGCVRQPARFSRHRRIRKADACNHVAAMRAGGLLQDRAARRRPAAVTSGWLRADVVNDAVDAPCQHDHCATRSICALTIGHARTIRIVWPPPRPPRASNSGEFPNRKPMTF